MARVCIGCGLKRSPDQANELMVDTGAATWPYTCPDTQGSPLYCNSDGALVLPPAIVATVDQEDDNNEFDTQQSIPTFPTLKTVATTNTVSVAPGSCGQEVLRIIEIEFQVDLTIPAGGRVRGYIQNDEMFDIRNDSANTITVHSPQVTKVLMDLQNAGQVSGQAAFQLSESGTLGATYDRVQWFHRIAHITTHTP
jgi:hypothetical protein